MVSVETGITMVIHLIGDRSQIIIIGMIMISIAGNAVVGQHVMLNLVVIVVVTVLQKLNGVVILVQLTVFVVVLLIAILAIACVKTIALTEVSFLIIKKGKHLMTNIIVQSCFH